MLQANVFASLPFYLYTFLTLQKQKKYKLGLTMDSDNNGQMQDNCASR